MNELKLSQLRRLLQSGRQNAAGLARELGISVATVMRGIAALRREGVAVRARRDRRGWRYSIDPAIPPGVRPKGLPRFHPRPREAHKGDFGRVLVVAGSYGMAGAAALACRAAYRAGAGLVYLAAPSRIYDALAAQLTETVIHPMEGDVLGSAHFERIAALAERCDVLAVGCGLGLSQRTVELVARVLEGIRRPIVLDADGLNAAAQRPDIRARKGPALVLTPHEGELARLLGAAPERIREDRQGCARGAARRFGASVVLKGHGTVVTDGARTYLNRTGNPGMATGGSGDVLTGIIAALIGQGFDAYDAARLGVYLHGRAGDIAAAQKGEVSLIASDIIDALPWAIRSRSSSPRT
jgi:NAD(P)H-hydrate epimerase